MRKIHLKDGTLEFISSDLFKAINEFSEILREKLGDDSERIFREILSDTFGYAVDACNEILDPDVDLWFYVKNPF